MKNKTFSKITILTLALASLEVHSALSNQEAPPPPPSPNPTNNNSNNSNNTPGYLPIASTQNATDLSIEAGSNSNTGLGVDMVDTSKSVIKPAISHSQGFRDPVIFAEAEGHGYNDNRQNGVDSDGMALRLGISFKTYYDIVCGAMYTFGSDWGKISETSTSLYTHTHLFTLFAGKNFYDWLNVGATFTTGIANEEASTPTTRSTRDIFDIAPSAYIGLAHNWKSWGFASTVDYLYMEDNLSNNMLGTARNDFNQSTGLLGWKNKATYFFNDRLDLTGSFKYNQVVHSNVANTLPASTHNEHYWGTAGLKLNYHPADKWQFSGGFDYVVLTRYYDQSWTATLGTSYAF